MVRIIPLQVPKSCKDHSEQAMYVQYSSYSQFLQLILEFDVFEGWGGVVLVHQLQEQMDWWVKLRGQGWRCRAFIVRQRCIATRCVLPFHFHRCYPRDRGRKIHCDVDFRHAM